MGDAVEKEDSIGGGFSLIALANIANRQGRRVADHICGRPVRPAPSQGTAILKVFGLTAAMTGWNERRLQALGRPYRVIHSHPMSHAGYYPGAEQMSLKLLFDQVDGAILGAQAVGGAGVDKRIDVLATAMAAGLDATALADLELAYAPPFSSAKDPVNMLGYMAENVMSGECDVVEAGEVEDLVAAGWTVVDVRTEAEHAQGAIPGSVNAPLDDAARPARGIGRRAVPRLLRSRSARPHRDHAVARRRPRGAEPGRRLPDLAGRSGGCGWRPASGGSVVAITLNGARRASRAGPRPPPPACRRASPTSSPP